MVIHVTEQLVAMIIFVQQAFECNNKTIYCYIIVKNNINSSPYSILMALADEVIL